VTAEDDYSRINKAARLPDIVTWELSPADKSDGIGDYMAVAMLIQRAKGSQFRIKVSTDANLGWFSKAKNSFPGRNKTIYLGPFGPAPPKNSLQKPPPDVSENKLKAAGAENLLQTFAFVHVPEKIEPRTIYTGPSTYILPFTWWSIDWFLICHTS
jgi:cytochrome c1